ncbi:hypothetical protein A1O1_00875 [Capronia coronata CBS 617.96]|uniref:Uncharacterized protein n=1 Tax=Capronia coronata CBS 617.96 TaxID=1182541 RepID=W9Z2E7_9EURO|nr:uncharacterized protein A1O1_00875 [Capronia coronata CBS 617.96]EXJ95751.1 hypothetical protein A1O1_00875 [Capronia coronata CBS 617.96]
MFKQERHMRREELRSAVEPQREYSKKLQAAVTKQVDDLNSAEQRLHTLAQGTKTILNEMWSDVQGNAEKISHTVQDALMARARSTHIEQVLKVYTINWTDYELQRKRVNVLIHSWRVEEFIKCRNSDDLERRAIWQPILDDTTIIRLGSDISGSDANTKRVQAQQDCWEAAITATVTLHNFLDEEVVDGVVWTASREVDRILCVDTCAFGTTVLPERNDNE